jgi:phosphoglycerate kinase
MAKKLTIDDLPNIFDSVVVVRVDFNVPLSPSLPATRDEAEITSDARIRAALPTIEKLMELGAKVVLMSHLGRPDGQVVEGLRLDVVAKHLSELINQPVRKLDDCVGPEVEAAIAAMKPSDVILLENVRFHREEESEDDSIRIPFAAELAKVTSIFVNDAFGCAHREHASTASIANVLHLAGRRTYCVAGYLMAKELEVLGNALTDPERPFTVILGGKKIEDKIPLIENLIGNVDNVLVGGGMCFTFLKALGHKVGKSLVDEKNIDKAKQMYDRAQREGTTIMLPIDFQTTTLSTKEVIDGAKKGFRVEAKHCAFDKIPDDANALDIGVDTMLMYRSVIAQSKMVVWNGPLGLFEVSPFQMGTQSIASKLAEAKAFTIIGGGDSAAALELLGYADQMDFISTGGGASIEFLQGNKLPGVEVLDENE